MNFYVAVQASSPKTSEIMRANLPSPGARTLARKNCGNEKKELKLPFIITEEKHVLSSLDAILGALKSRGQEHAAITIAIDGTAVVPIHEVSHKYGAIMGGAHPDHFVKIPEGSSDEELKALLFDDKAVLAKEVKTAVVAIQNVPAGVRSFYILFVVNHRERTNLRPSMRT
jgi:hypothetical protein